MTDRMKKLMMTELRQNLDPAHSHILTVCGIDYLRGKIMEKTTDLIGADNETIFTLMRDIATIAIQGMGMYYETKGK